MSRQILSGTLVGFALLIIPASYATPVSPVRGPSATIVTISGIPQDVSTMTVTGASGAVFNGSGNGSIIGPFAYAGSSGFSVYDQIGGSVSLSSNGGIQSGPAAFRINNGGELSFDPVAQFSVEQMVPAANANYVPPSTQNGISVVSSNPNPGFAAPTALEIAAPRPDFSYHSGKLNFQQQATHDTSQNGMGIGPGLPVGVTRYVPAGEF